MFGTYIHWSNPAPPPDIYRLFLRGGAVKNHGNGQRIFQEQMEPVRFHHRSLQCVGSNNLGCFSQRWIRRTHNSQSAPIGW